MKICGVYTVTNPIGEVYIGQSSNINDRWQSHRSSSNHFERKFKDSILKYGHENHLFKVIEECDKSELRIKERFWQEQYFLDGVPLLNLVLAKIGPFPTRCHPSSKELMANRTIRVHTGLKRSYESKENMRVACMDRSKPVCQYDLDMNFMAEYRSAHEAARQTKLQRPHISECCRGTSKTHGGFKWKYKD